MSEEEKEAKLSEKEQLNLLMSATTFFTKIYSFLSLELSSSVEKIHLQTITKHNPDTKDIVVFYENKAFSFCRCYVKFTEPRVTIVRCYYSAFKSGKVKNPYHNNMFNVACVGETNVNNNDGSRKKSYYYWKNMISRCYKSDINVNPTYVECMVCNEWLCYANFEKWFDKNYYTIPNEKICLDKDILVKGNKIYSPQTCCFVPQKINNMFENNEKETKGIQYYKNRS